MGLLIKQGKIRYNDDWFVGDILIEKDTITKIEKHIETEEHQVIHAEGYIVTHGFIDVHVHLREPGYEAKETIATGAKAAVRGGFTTIAPMPNTKPITDSPDKVAYIHEKSKEAALAKVLPIGAITIDEKGMELADFEGMKQQGVIGFSDDGRGVQSSLIMKNAMKKAKELDLPIIAHCEDNSLVEDGVIHAGDMAKKLQVKGIPSESEYIQIARDLILAEVTGAHYHVCHISTKESVELIRQAKKKGIHATTEVTPHHLLLSDQDIAEPYGNYKMNPPLRSEEDRLALIEGLLDGTIDMIATDHAPHTEEEKKRGLHGPFGIVGLETAFPLLYTHLVKKNILSFENLIKLLTEMPAKVFAIDGGKLEVGKKADITIIDINKKQKVEKEKFFSKGKNTPFDSWELYGWPKYTLVNGKITWEDREV